MPDGTAGERGRGCPHIAEEIIFLAEARIVRHQGKLGAEPTPN